jgi:hypothetical protein
MMMKLQTILALLCFVMVVIIAYTSNNTQDLVYYSFMCLFNLAFIAISKIEMLQEDIKALKDKKD